MIIATDFSPKMIETANMNKKNYPNKHVIFIEKLEDVADYIKENASSNDIVMTMGAGDVFKICGMLLN